MFPMMFSDMKGITGELGEIRIPLNPDTKPMQQRPYRMNLKYKTKVKTKIDKMLEAKIIEPIEE
jgi:hypothetical protein